MLKLRRCLVLLLSGFCLLSPALAGTSLTRDAGAALVTSLYKNFAWQAVFASDAGGTLAAQPRAELEKYFDAELTESFLKEQKCLARRKGELCHLDFDPLFASQDPAATNLTVKPAAGGKVMVEFVYPSGGEKIRLEFSLKSTAQGWRITDIRYLNMQGISLRKVLRSRP